MLVKYVYILQGYIDLYNVAYNCILYFAMQQNLSVSLLLNVGRFVHGQFELGHFGLGCFGLAFFQSRTFRNYHFFWADQPRTNNVTEGWNNTFQSYHPGHTILQSGSSLSAYKSSVLGFL